MKSFGVVKQEIVVFFSHDREFPARSNLQEEKTKGE